MTQINLITAPDILFNDCEEIFFVYPNDNLRFDLQENYLNKIQHDVNVYMLDGSHKQLTKKDFEWATNVFKQCDVCIIDIDNTNPDFKPLLSYFMCKNKTFWLTTESDPVYTYISKNRVYDTTFLLERKQYA